MSNVVRSRRGKQVRISPETMSLVSLLQADHAETFIHPLSVARTIHRGMEIAVQRVRAERARSPRRQAVEAAHPDLRCPHCHVWVGDLDDPAIADVSVSHDMMLCRSATEGGGESGSLAGVS